MTAPERGLRERKKQRTRQLIADTVRRLFAERGFEQVTVAEIAREAEVAPATVFNYFPANEDLFYSRLEAFQERLLSAIRDRGRGQSVLAAFAAFLLDRRGVLAMNAVGGEEQAKALAGASAAGIRESVRAQAERAIAQLELGLGDVGVRDART